MVQNNSIRKYIASKKGQAKGKTFSEFELTLMYGSKKLSLMVLVEN
jgi:hypothetical protein